MKFFIHVFVLLMGLSVFSQVNQKKQESLFGSDITIIDYENYISNVDRKMIRIFGAKKNQTVARIQHSGNRKYSVKYVDNFTGRITDGFYDGNQNDVLSYEKFKVWELERRKKEDEKRLKEIELLRKKKIRESEERKKKLEEERIRKEKQKIIDERRKVIEYDEISFPYYFFFRDELPKDGMTEYKVQRFFNFLFNVNENFLNEDQIVENKIEVIGDLIVEDIFSNSLYPFFKITIGVRDFFDDTKIKYFINNKEIDFDLGLKGSKWINGSKPWFKPLKHLKDLYKSEDYLFKNKIIYDGFNFSLPIKPYKDFQNFNELVDTYAFYNFLFKNRYKDSNSISRIINYLIANRIAKYPDDSRLGGRNYDRVVGSCNVVAYEIDDIIDCIGTLEISSVKVKKNIVRVDIERISSMHKDDFTYYIDTKKSRVEILDNGSNKVILNKDDVSRILNGEYEFFHLMNSY